MCVCVSLSESGWLVNEHFSQLIPKSLTNVTTEYPAASVFKTNSERIVFVSHCNENHKI